MITQTCRMLKTVYFFNDVDVYQLQEQEKATTSLEISYIAEEKKLN